MAHVLLLIFTVSLLYLSIAGRLRTLLEILVFQGILLFGMALTELREVNTLNLILILLETIVFKTIAAPVFLSRLIRRNRITRESEPFVPHFASLLMVTGIIAGAILLSHSIEDVLLDKISFVVALSTIFTGLYLVATRKKIITHVMGYLVMENGIFILSLAVGNEMPMLVNLGIMLDIFVSVLILGIFINKIGDVFREADVDHLTALRD